MAPERSKLRLCSTHSVMLKYGSKGALLPHFCLQARKKLRLRALTLGSQKTGSFELRLMAPAPSPCEVKTGYKDNGEKSSPRPELWRKPLQLGCLTAEVSSMARQNGPKIDATIGELTPRNQNKWKSD
ncbi:hypothetical protein ACFE04_019808 [Oxalis oulophora]